jgi:enoyl-CoA hydratase/carnithine racemase
MDAHIATERRDFLAAALGGIAGLSALDTTAARADEGNPDAGSSSREITMSDIPLSSNAKITVERRGAIVLVGINRPGIQNRIDPEAFVGLAKAYHDYDHDPSLRAAILFGHGDNFSRGIDVDGFRKLVESGNLWINGEGLIDPLAKRKPGLTKPLIVAVHGDTWNMGNELFLVGDIRIAAANTNFGQDENTHGRFPGGGSTVRFVREAGWGNAMRYMLTGDHWSAQEAYRVGTIQEIAATPTAALDRAFEIANKVAACGPLGIKTTLASAHLAVDAAADDALAKLDAQFGALFHTHDFVEGRKAEAEGRSPIYLGH